MTLATFYPLADPFPGAAERFDAGVEARAQLTGEKRPPNKGEWYLSGALPAAYCAMNDLTAPYMICRIVIVRQRITWEIVE